jgi:hypothetical protein
MGQSGGDRDGRQLLLWSVEDDPNIRLRAARCGRCGRALRVARSILRRLGPVCFKKTEVQDDDEVDED